MSRERIRIGISSDRSRDKERLRATLAQHGVTGVIAGDLVDHEDRHRGGG